MENFNIGNSKADHILNQFEDSLEKGGKAVPVGTVKVRPGGTFVKTADGWKYKGKGSGTKKSSEKKESATTSKKEAPKKKEVKLHEGKSPSNKVYADFTAKDHESVAKEYHKMMEDQDKRLYKLHKEHKIPSNDANNMKEYEKWMSENPKIKKELADIRDKMNDFFHQGQVHANKATKMEKEAKKKKANKVIDKVIAEKKKGVVDKDGDSWSVGQEVKYLGYPAKIKGVKKDLSDRVWLTVSYDKGNGSTTASQILSTSGSITPGKKEAPKKEEVKKDVPKKETSESNVKSLKERHKALDKEHSAKIDEWRKKSSDLQSKQRKEREALSSKFFDGSMSGDRGSYSRTVEQLNELDKKHTAQRNDFK